MARRQARSTQLPLLLLYLFLLLLLLLFLLPVMVMLIMKSVGRLPTDKAFVHFALLLVHTADLEH